MFLDRIIIKWAHVADVHMRIDQTRYQKSVATIDLLRVRARDKISPDFRDSSIANDNAGMGEGSRALRRNDGHVPDHGPVVYNLRFVGIRTGEKNENEGRQ